MYFFLPLFPLVFVSLPEPDSSVGILTRPWTGLEGEYNRGSSRFFSSQNLQKPPKPAMGPTQSHVQWSTEVKRPGREADHSLSSSAEFKNEWSCTSASVLSDLVAAEVQTFLTKPVSCLLSFRWNSLQERRTWSHGGFRTCSHVEVPRAYGSSALYSFVFYYSHSFCPLVILSLSISHLRNSIPST